MAKLSDELQFVELPVNKINDSARPRKSLLKPALDDECSIDESLLLAVTIASESHEHRIRKESQIDSFHWVAHRICQPYLHQLQKVPPNFR